MPKPTDVYTWANPGPGARRGLNRIFRGGPKNGPDKNKNEQFVAEMRHLLELANSGEQEPHVGQHVPLPLEMREIEHSLCEFDKYMRVLKDEGRPRSRYHAPK